MRAEESKRVDIVVHPEYHARYFGYNGLDVFNYEKAVIKACADAPGRVLLLEEYGTSDIGLIESVIDEGLDLTKISTLNGSGLLRLNDDADRFWELVDGTTHFRVHGSYLHQCVALHLSALTAALLTNNPAHLTVCDTRDFGDLAETPFDIKVGKVLNNTSRRQWYRPLVEGDGLFDQESRVYGATESLSLSEPS